MRPRGMRALTVTVLALLAATSFVRVPASRADPAIVNNGDGTADAVWNFGTPADYVTAQVKAIIQDAQQGKYDRELYTNELADLIGKSLSDGLAEKMKAYGAFKSIELIGRKNEGNNRRYNYRLVYENETFVVTCTYNQSGKIGLPAHPVRPLPHSRGLRDRRRCVQHV